jgi:hypothetical protein
MTEKIKVTTLKGFLNEGTYVKRGTEIEVTRDRYNDLKENDLVEDPEVTKKKAAAKPENKKGQAPANK